MTYLFYRCSTMPLHKVAHASLLTSWPPDANPVYQSTWLSQKVPAISNFLDHITTVWHTVKAKLTGQAAHNRAAVDKARCISDKAEGDLLLLSSHHLQLKVIAGRMKLQCVKPFQIVCAMLLSSTYLQLCECTRFSTFPFYANSMGPINHLDQLSLKGKQSMKLSILHNTREMANTASTFPLARVQCQ